MENIIQSFLKILKGYFILEQHVKIHIRLRFSVISSITTYLRQKKNPHTSRFFLPELRSY